MFCTPRHLCGLAFLCATLMPGCYYGRPHLWDIRPQSMQKRQLERFDPYPDNDIGPPVVGARPPGFQDQISETLRSRWGGPIPVGGGLLPLDPKPDPPADLP
ncbi:MAG: hypothetical protein N2C12_02180 [Planctomycetales bacterium]